MIFVVAGTQDGREIAKMLLEKGYDVAASVVSRYGGELLAHACGQKCLINDKPLDEAALQAYMQEHDISLLVDASHPYAANVSANAIKACAALDIPYIRYERDLAELTYDKIAVVHSYEEAAQAAANLGRKIFLTTGSRNLEKFVQSPALQECELTARVLPTAEVIDLCEKAGLDAGHIVALQGPFSKALNVELFRKYEAEVIITKNSGTIGGTDTKFAAAAELGLPIVLINRPKLAYPRLTHTYAEILDFAQECYRK
ncbi:putative cobalt-precorrin-6A reductase [Selenomonas ruminantium subsp. lactilytica TAM6421]|uniref:Putative cobalt-precorrin-6A reductase n=1 Tax=Selenomonas ruminantium subsp. lactilytica (strain NBRC 103574 / TAM6421) TaxID=927704 RepID=I0GPA1_SELRL|nr:precorrin-6A reductase [Selenomonas ruminantium]BAL82588.1 putative cobalt-precorrin-6A reductase [Selenomonas ruminantium subsp. lactilytica TAM6421]